MRRAHSLTAYPRAQERDRLLALWGARVEGRGRGAEANTERKAHNLNTFFSHKVFLKSFGESQLPHETVNVSSWLVIVYNSLTILWGS